jgi:ankyrin repeat protein
MSGVNVFRRLLWAAIVPCLVGQAFASSEPRLPLEQAAQKGDLELAKSLLAEGQSEYARSSALDLAIQAGHDEIIDLLIASGTKGALWRAAEKGDAKLVERLLAKGQDQTAYDAALRSAARLGNRQIAELVLAKGANVNAKLGSEFTPLFFAAAGERNYDAFARFSGLPLDHFPERMRKARDRNSLDSILEAMNRRGGINTMAETKAVKPPPVPLDLVELLIQHGADVNAAGGACGLGALHYAIYGGDTEVIKLLLDHGARVTPLLVSGRLPSRYIAPLHLAAYYGELAICELLIERGAEVNARAPGKDVTGWAHGVLQTPLHYAVDSGNAKLVEMLIDRGADVNAADGSGETPLHLATRGKEQAVVEVLLSHGAKVDAMDKYNQTPLYWAVQRRNASFVQLLVSHGAKADVENNTGETPTSLAVRDGSNEIVKLLTPGPAATTPHVAANMGDVETLARLIEAGANVNDVDAQGQTVLHAAVRAGQVSAVEWLLAHGADPNRADKVGLTPLLTALHIAQDFSFSKDPNEVARFNALKAKQKQVLTLLISRGAEPGFRYGIPKQTVQSHAAMMADLIVDGGDNLEPSTDTQGTLLHRAAWWGREKTVQALLELGADVNAVDGMGATPLQAATQSGSTRYWDVIGGPHVAVFELLIKHGAQVNARNVQNETPLHGAASRGDVNAVGLLIRHGANVNASDNTGCTPLHKATEHGAVDVMALLVEHGADPNAIDKEGNTPLLLLLGSYQLGREERKGRIIDYATQLIAKGVRLDVQNREGATALHKAAALGSPALLEVMLNRGASVNGTSSKGWTALHSAVSSGNMACVEMLLKHGAKANGLGVQPGNLRLPMFSERTGTPLQIAASHGYNDIIRLLLAAGADVNARDAEGLTALDLARRSDHPSTVKLLLDNGAKGTR